MNTSYSDCDQIIDRATLGGTYAQRVAFKGEVLRRYNAHEQLLAALEAMVGQVNALGARDQGEQYATEQARAAIARAKGQA